MMYEIITTRNERRVVDESTMQTVRACSGKVSYIDGVERFDFSLFAGPDAVVVAWPKGELTA